VIRALSNHRSIQNIPKQEKIELKGQQGKLANSAFDARYVLLLGKSLSLVQEWLEAAKQR